MTIEDEVEALYSSIVDRNKKRETYIHYNRIIVPLLLFLFFGGLFSLEYFKQSLKYLLYYWSLIITFLLIFGRKFDPTNIVIFNSDVEKLFFSPL